MVIANSPTGTSGDAEPEVVRRQRGQAGGQAEGAGRAEDHPQPGRPRPAESSAPVTDPIAMIEFISPKAPASRPNSVADHRGDEEHEVQPRVPTMNTATSTTTMSGRKRT